MRATFISAICILLFASTWAQPEKPQAPAGPSGKVLEGKVRKAWEDFKNKNKDGFSAILADGFREVEEGGNGFTDKKGILEAIDQFELTQYTLRDFDVRPIAPNAALVTYMAEYDGKYGGKSLHSKTAYGEIWTKQGREWKLLYVQETNVT